jgi:hypothetical protein
VNDDDRTATQVWRKRRLRQVMLFVTFPGVLLGTASMTAAYSTGWMTQDRPESSCTPVMVTAPARASFTVNVLNATGRDGVAKQVAAGLAKRKFTVGAISTAPESWYITQSAVIHHGPQGLDQALLTASQIPGAKLFADSRTGSTVDVVIGLAYERLGPVSTPAEPVSAPPGPVSAAAEPVSSAGPEAATRVTITRPCT